MPPQPQVSERMEAPLASVDVALHHPRGQSPLLNLPRETRDLIYSYLFAGKTYSSISTESAHRRGISGLEIRCICRRVSAEALEALCKEAKFLLHLIHFCNAPKRPFLQLLVQSQAKIVTVIWEISSLEAVRVQAAAMNHLTLLLTSPREHQRPLRMILQLNEILHDCMQKMHCYVHVSLSTFRARNVTVVLGAMVFGCLQVARAG